MKSEFRQKMEADFRNFLYAIWKHLQLPDPTEIQYDMGDYLATGPSRRVVEGFRGVGKSWITGALVLWWLYKDPDERVLVVSASKDRAEAFTTFVKRLIDDIPWLNYLTPNAEKGCRDSIRAFDVGPAAIHQAPSVRSVGITGQLTGGRATKIVADDVEVPKNALTITMRDKLAEAIKEFDAVLSPGGEIIYLGTPQIEFSVYTLLPERGYDVRIWPVEVPGKKWLEKQGHLLAPMIQKRIDEGTPEGTPLEPTRFPELELIARKTSYGKAGYALQFMLDTSLADEERNPLKLKDFIVMGCDHAQAPVRVAWGSSPDQIRNDLPCVGLPGDRLYGPMFVHKEYEPYTDSVCYVDPSGEGMDDTAWCIAKLHNGFVYILRLQGTRKGFAEETLRAIARDCKRYGVQKIVCESNYGGGMFTTLLRPVLQSAQVAASVEDISNHGQKERRIIDTLAPALGAHRIVLSEEVIRDDQKVDDHTRQGLFQLTRLSREKGCLRYDDRVEAIAGAVAHFSPHLSLNVDDLDAVQHQKNLDKEIESFEEHVHSMFNSGSEPPAERVWAGLRSL